MEGMRIREGETASLGRVDGDLEAGDHVLIRSAEGRRVIVGGRASFDGSVELDCDFECQSLRSRDGMVRVSGELLVHGDIDVEEALYTRGSVRAERIDVGGKLVAGASLESKSVDVGGSLEVQGDITADTVDAGGTFEVRGEMRVRDLDVGGRVELSGGEVSGDIDVGGRLVARKALKFNKIETGGTVELAGGEGKEIEVGGRLLSRGDLRCEKVEVGGLVEVEGNLSVADADVGGRIGVSGELKMERRLEVGGVADIGGLLSGMDVEVGGSLRALKGLLSGSARIGGRVETAQGLKAERIELSRATRAVGTLVGGDLFLGKGAQVQDVYCDRLVSEGWSRMGKVFVRDAELGDNTVVERLVYTGELREGRRVVHQNPPQKVESLPPFPL